MSFFASLFNKKDLAQLQTAISDGALLVDVRSPEEFAGGSVPGAINIPLDRMPSQLARFRDQQAIIVFCRSGNRSRQAKSLLEQHGVPRVLNGGTWQEVKSLVRG